LPSPPSQTDKHYGLTDALVQERFEFFGFNELAEKKVHPLLRFLSYFWAPMPIMIWCAALVELIKASSTGEGWPDFVVLLILQFANGMVGYVEETNAGNAIAALKERLAPECHCKRNGQYVSGARVVVPFNRLSPSPSSAHAHASTSIDRLPGFLLC
jgi:H+-transporting ATPase